MTIPQHKTAARLLSLLVLVITALSANAALQVDQLFCDYASESITLNTSTPHFSWRLGAEARDQQQSAFQILVAFTPEELNENRGGAWDSGQVSSSQSCHIPYAGKALESNREYYWKVRVWDQSGAASPYSATASFSMALLTQADWKAQWIGRGNGAQAHTEIGYLSDAKEADEAPSPITHEGQSTLLRKTFSTKQSVKRARVYVCGLGLYELYLNGAKVGKDLLGPPKTQYAKQIFYNSYDVTEAIQQGENALGIMLGNGWFNPYPKWWSWRMQWFGSQRALLQLSIDYADGSQELIVTGEDWKCAPGPVTFNCIYDGEHYDAQLEQAGWDRPGFDDSSWDQAQAVQAPRGALEAQQMEGIQVTQEIRPVSFKEVEEGVWIFDMGQNFAGWARLKVQGPKGSTVCLRYAENLDEAGKLDPKSNNKAAATGKYTLKGEGVETYSPYFTYYGFRYVELTGFPGVPTLDSLTGCVVHSNCPPAGEFSCGNELLNHLQACILWSQRSNMVGYPMDCPQRDERLGWMGDAHVTAEEAMHNFFAPRFYRSWLEGVQREQVQESGNLPYISPRPITHENSCAWSSGYILMLWYHYLHYGDPSILADHFESMKDYVDFLASQATDSIMPPDKYGDWLSVVFNWQRGEPISTATAYLAYTTDIVAKTAAVLKQEKVAQDYAQRAQAVKAAYHARFFDADKGYYESGSQFSQAFPLFLGIPPKEEEEKVMQRLLDDIMKTWQGHLSTGMLGTQYMMELLREKGEMDIAYLLATQRDYPSWGGLIENRTTLSERWNQSGSNNHILFGSIGSWLYRSLAGIQADEAKPGFEHIRIRPYVHPELGWVKASLETLRGTVRSHWKLEGNDLSLSLSIPANCIATLHLLAHSLESVTESETPLKACQGIHDLRIENRHAIITLGSGNYSFLSKEMSDLLPLPYAPPPEISPKDSFIEAPNKAKVTLSSPLPEAAIHYSLDGSEPCESSPKYDGPFLLSKSQELRSKAFHSGYQPSLVASQTYHFIDPEKNGLSYALYEGAFTKIPDFDTLTPTKTGHSLQCGLRKLDTPKENFALKFTGQLQIETEGEYTFRLASNDGSKLYVDGQCIIDNDGEHALYEKSGKAQLKTGLQPITISYFQSGGGAVLVLTYEGPNLKKQRIPASCYFRE